VTDDIVITDAAAAPSAPAAPASPAAPGTPRDISRTARALAKRLQGRSRSVWVTVMLLIAVAAAVLLGVEAVLFALGRPPALVSLDAVRAALTDGGTTGAVVAVASGLFAALCLWGALAPGRTHRRAFAAGRVPMVVDDAIVAGALSRTAAASAALGSSHVTTRLGGRRARIAITPATGFAVDGAAVSTSVDELLSRLGAAPALTARVDVASEGRLS